MLTTLTLLFLTPDNAIDMVNINENIRFLRKQKGLTQEQFAEKVGINRSVVGAYEEGRASPPLETLLKMAELFQITADDFISKNLSKGEEASPIGAGGNSPKFKVLSITVDKDDNENIELVPQKASAGYLNGFADPEYIEELPRFQLPVLPKNATYRAHYYHRPIPGEFGRHKKWKNLCVGDQQRGCCLQAGIQLPQRQWQTLPGIRQCRLHAL